MGPKLKIIGTDKNMITQGVLRYKADDDNWYHPEEIISLINKNAYTFVVNINDIEITLQPKHLRC